MKKFLLAIVVLFVGSQVFAQNQASKFDFTPDGLEPFSPLSQFSSQWCPKEDKDLVTDTLAEIDLRSCNLSSFDLSSLPRETLRKITFDDKTIWPKEMPEWFDINKIYKTSKTPGLHIKDLHNQGITGAGVGIAIIDATLSPHQEYNKNLVFYKKFSNQDDGDMHGTAVASIAVGNNVGVAPGAKLYYIAGKFTNYDKEKRIFNAALIAEYIEYLLELNETLPKEEKIFVISISRGFGDNDYGRENFLKALDKAEKQGILVLKTQNVSGINRHDYYINPQNRASFIYTTVWDDDLSLISEENRIAVPNDYRVIASPTGKKDYVAYADGGLSWAVPYLAGIAALAKQVKPDLTPQEFLDVAHKTAQSAEVKTKDGKQTAMMNTFVNPQALIKELQNRKNSLNKEKEEIVKSLEKGLKNLPQKVNGGELR